METTKKNPVRIIVNAKIYEDRGIFHEAVRIEGGRIVQTGTASEVLETAPAGTEKIDAGGRLVLPAFHDSHLHLLWLGRREGHVECAGADSVGEVLRRTRELIARVKPPAGFWIQGAGINPDLFTGEKRDLTRDDLDGVSREYPVVLSRHCGHTIYCNSLALTMAGIDKEAPEVAGGTIEKDENARPKGILRENANALIRDLIPPASKAELKNFAALGMKRALALGITSAGTYDTGGADFDDIAGLYRELDEAFIKGGEPVLRVCMQCGVSSKEEFLDAYIQRGLSSGQIFCSDLSGGPLLKMGPLKLFADGTLGGQTAWMRKPYHDKPETSGFPVLENGLFRRLVKKAAAAKIQVVVHAIGDAAAGAVLDAFDEVTSAGNNPLRHGIVHCQITRPEDLERMVKNKILALVQPVFLADDRYVLESRVGKELAATSYAWGSMERLGVPVSYGTDAPVSPFDPLLGIHWAVNRSPPSGSPGERPPDAEENPFNPQERVDVWTAVDAYTLGAAFSSFDEETLGRIKPGYLADLVFLDRDIFSIPPKEIGLAKAVRTMLAGETVWEA